MKRMGLYRLVKYVFLVTVYVFWSCNLNLHLLFLVIPIVVDLALATDSPGGLSR